MEVKSEKRNRYTCSQVPPGVARLRLTRFYTAFVYEAEPRNTHSQAEPGNE
ncbi:Uncharacterized protein dnm_004580 [Desulfonema magnum]|uniref:Uncharacterized protein n=1 Tax=Desulfonema magnum TaxID=45655 RepID=A0A975GKB8_9BACT|nr:Uncharacterized protein dnm_004580 [Desulfonema magnum]